MVVRPSHLSAVNLLLWYSPCLKKVHCLIWIQTVKLYIFVNHKALLKFLIFLIAGIGINGIQKCNEIRRVICIRIRIGSNSNVVVSCQYFLFIGLDRIIITFLLRRSSVSRSGGTLFLGLWSWQKFPHSTLPILCQVFSSFFAEAFNMSLHSNR